MGWLWGRLDSLVGALFAASFGLASSQLLEFIQQYRQRLGGHLAEAQLALSQTLDNQVFRGLDLAARQALATPQQERLGYLRRAYAALSDAGPWEAPWAFFRRIDFSIAEGTLRVYQPALPISLPSLTYALAGMVLGWLLWELIKAVFRPPRRVRI